MLKFSLSKYAYRAYNKYWAYNNPREYWVKRGEKYDKDDYVTQSFPDDEWLLQFLLQMEISSALEVGCATGRLLNIISNYYNKVEPNKIELSGADFSLTMLEHARKKLDDNGHKKILLYQASVLSLPFADHSYQLVYTRGLLMHMKTEKDVKTAISELLRVCSRFCVLIEEVDSAPVPRESGYSPNGLARFWDYQKIISDSDGKLIETLSFQNKEKLAVFIIEPR